MPTMPTFPTGVVAASLTPFREDLTVDTDRLVAHVHWLFDNGCDGVLLFGTTGEGLSLTPSERMDALDAVLDAGVAPERLLVGTGAGALPHAVEATQGATRRGVGGVLVPPPFHVPGVTDEGVFRSYDALLARVDPDDLRVYFYHYPKLTQTGVSFPVIQRLIDAYPGVICGVKDSSGEWDHTEALIHDFPDLQIFAGTERFLLPGLQEGGAGCISATVNVTAPLAAEVAQTWGDGGAPDAAQDALTGFRGRLARLPFIPALKHLWAWRRDDDAWLTTRPPLAPLPDGRRDELLAIENDLAAHFDSA